MSLPTVCSYCTPEYSAQADRLAASAEAAGFAVDIAREKSLGSWRANVMRKPHHLLAALEKHERVLWLDADAEVMATPAVLPSPRGHVHPWVWDEPGRVTSDVIACVRPAWPGEVAAGMSFAINCGTFFIRRTASTLQAIREWARLAAANRHEKVLEEPLLFFSLSASDVHLSYLPWNYIVVQRRAGHWERLADWAEPKWVGTPARRSTRTPGSTAPPPHTIIAHHYSKAKRPRWM